MKARVPLSQWTSTCGRRPAWGRSQTRRAIDPLPALLVNNRYYVDLEAAGRWLERRDARRSVDVGALVDSIVRDLEAKIR